MDAERCVCCGSIIPEGSQVCGSCRRLSEPQKNGVKNSQWKITSNYIDGQTLYAVYRLRDVEVIDHSRNREYATDYMPDKEQARQKAARLNDAEVNDQA